jgi:hypothetical protein
VSSFPPFVNLYLIMSFIISEWAGANPWRFDGAILSLEPSAVFLTCRYAGSAKLSTFATRQCQRLEAAGLLTLKCGRLGQRSRCPRAVARSGTGLVCFQ